MSADPKSKTFSEHIEVAGNDLMERVKELVHEGNVRHIRIKHEGHEVLEIPVTLVVAGGLLAPVVAALGAFAAAVTHCTIEVVREDDSTSAGMPAAPARVREE